MLLHWQDSSTQQKRILFAELSYLCRHNITCIKKEARRLEQAMQASWLDSSSFIEWSLTLHRHKKRRMVAGTHASRVLLQNFTMGRVKNKTKKKLRHLNKLSQSFFGSYSCYRHCLSPSRSVTNRHKFLSKLPLLFQNCHSSPITLYSSKFIRSFDFPGNYESMSCSLAWGRTRIGHDFSSKLDARLENFYLIGSLEILDWYSARTQEIKGESVCAI